MDTSALVVVAVAGVVALAALWIGAGWLRQATRSRRRHAAPAPAAAPARPARASESSNPSRSGAAAAALAATAAVAAPAPPLLHDDDAPPTLPPGDPTWSSTTFPSTLPQLPILGDELSEALPERDLVAEFAETLPMEFLSN